MSGCCHGPEPLSAEDRELVEHFRNLELDDDSEEGNRYPWLYFLTGMVLIVSMITAYTL